MGGGFAIVSHPFADYTQGYFVALCAGCPIVTADLVCQFKRQPNHLPYLLQIVVHFAQCIPVYIMLVKTGGLDDGQKVAGCVGRVFINHQYLDTLAVVELPWLPSVSQLIKCS